MIEPSRDPTRENNSDHELLVRIDEKMKFMQSSFEAERLNNQAQANRVERDFEIYKRETALLIKSLQDDVRSLQTTRIQFYSASTLLSAVIGLLFKVFWPK